MISIFPGFKIALRCKIALLFSVSIAFLTGCDDSPATSPAPSPAFSITLEFTRGDGGAGLDPFTVKATILLDGIPANNISPNVILSKGAHAGISNNGDGTYTFTVTPIQTGEHEVIVSHQSVSITETALVLKSVHPDWEQPMSVPGLVNTAGYEDGVTITPDGQYLFVQTGPQRRSGGFLFDAPTPGGCGGNRLAPPCSHEWLDTLIGTYIAPERPGFFDGRFSDNIFLHNSNLYGVPINGAPNWALATMFFGFKRQSDGTFAEPFYVAFDDLNDAIINPFGLSFRLNGDGTATIVFAFDDPSIFGSIADVYTMDIILGENTSLGTYDVVGFPPGRGVPFPSAQVNFGATNGTQGNPHIYHLADGTIQSIWTDDELDSDSDSSKISVYVLNGAFPNGTWTKVILPTNVNSATDQIQPFFTGQGLFYTKDFNIGYSGYSGLDTVADYNNNANWASPVFILERDSGNVPIGKIVTLGEPTIGTVGGTQYLYFVYGYVRDVDIASGVPDFDFQAGFVMKR